MKFGNFEVCLLDTKQNKFKERTVLGKSHVVATTGQEFSVQVSLKRDESSKQFPFTLLKIGLYVDGQDVNYWKRINTNDAVPEVNEVSTVFWGFKKNVNELRAFVFSTPISNHVDTFDSITQNSLGQIKVVIFEAALTGGIFHNKSGYYEIKDQKVSGDHKIWQQPSVTTKAGRRVDDNKERFDPLPRWVNLTEAPTETFQVPYHTTDMLDLIDQLSVDISAGGNMNHHTMMTSNIHTTSSQLQVEACLSTRKRAGGAGDVHDSTDINGNKRIHTSSEMTQESVTHSSVSDSLDASGSNLQQQEGAEDTEISYLPVVKIVPFIDLTDETQPPSWSSIEQCK